MIFWKLQNFLMFAGRVFETADLKDGIKQIRVQYHKNICSIRHLSLLTWQSYKILGA